MLKNTEDNVYLYFAGEKPFECIKQDRKIVEDFRLAVINGEQITYAQLDKYNYVVDMAATERG